MATKETKQKIQYGLQAAKIGPTDSESTVSKAHFFELMEANYPSGEGWVVYATETTPVPTMYNGTSTELLHVTYHLRKEVA